MPSFDFVLAGRYKLIAPLGEGGMAAVYRARDLRLNREVAVKVLHQDLTRDPDFLSRFQREAQIVASLSHPNIVPVYDVGEEDGSHFIVMEFVRGRTLKERLETGGPLPEPQACEVMASVLDALQYAHQQGLVHRDVKPQNILLTREGLARLADFGIARVADGSATRTAVILGSAHYLSPEQARGDEATVQSDVYACGVVLFEMLSGQPPFDGPNALSIATQHLQKSPPALTASVGSITGNTEHAVEKALAKDPAERFHDASAFAAALQVTHSSSDETTVQPLGLGATQALVPTGRSAEAETSPHTALRPAGGHPTPEPSIVLRRSTRKVWALTILAAAAVGAAFYGASTYGAGRIPSYPSLLNVAGGAALATILFLMWLNNRAWKYRMDGEAAVVQWGLLTHHRFGMPLRTVTTVELKQSPIDRLFAVGTVELCARDHDGAERRVVMEDLPHPRKTYEDLLKHVGRTGRPQRQLDSFSAGSRPEEEPP